MMASIDSTAGYETSMADPNALENDLRSFYLTGSQEPSLFEEWEHGIARGDSTTPSICSPTYRWWILEHLRNALGRDRKNLLLSLGSGNAFVERVLGRARCSHQPHHRSPCQRRERFQSSTRSEIQQEVLCDAH